MTHQTPVTVKIELTGNDLWEHRAYSSDGRVLLRRGSCFDCVNSDGYMTFDEDYARSSAADEFNKA